MMDIPSWLVSLALGTVASLIAALLVFLLGRTRPLFASRFPPMLGKWEVETEIKQLPGEQMIITHQFLDRFSGRLEATDSTTKKHQVYDFHARFVTDDTFRYRFRPRADRDQARFIDDGVGMIRIDHSRERGAGVTVWVGIYTGEEIQPMKVRVCRENAPKRSFPPKAAKEIGVGRNPSER